MLIWINDFLHYMLAQRGCSPRTHETYRIALNDCADYMRARNPNISWTEVDTLCVRRWVAWMMENGYAPNTVNKSLSALRSFYKFLLREGRVSVDPARLVSNPKIPKRLPTFIKESEMDLLFSHYPFSDDYIGCRDRTLLLLLYHTGIRAAELLALNLQDIRESSSTIRVTGKGNKQRIIPYGKELAEALNRYLSLRAATYSSLPHDEVALFLNKRGQRLSYTSLRKMVNATLSAVTTQQKRSPHVLRHSFATAMLSGGAQLEAIRQLLGHESVTTTAIYTHTTLAELKEQYARSHPHDEE